MLALATRLGGIALVAAILMSLALFIINGDLGSEAVLQVQDNWPIWLGAAGCFADEDTVTLVLKKGELVISKAKIDGLK